MWMSFAAKNAKTVSADSKKEKFAYLSYMWKNRMAHLVSVNVEYLESLHEERQSLKKRLTELEIELTKTKELLAFFINTN